MYSIGHVVTCEFIEMFIKLYCSNDNIKECHFNNVLVNRNFFLEHKQLMRFLEKIKFDTKQNVYSEVLDVLIDTKIKYISIKVSGRIDNPSELFNKIAASEIESFEFDAHAKDDNQFLEIPINSTVKHLLASHSISIT